MPRLRESARLRGWERGRRLRRASLATDAAGLIALGASGAGCQLPNARRAAEQESVLAIVFSGVPTPEEAERMANDPTNPDRRARGLTLLMNAPFGGEPVYVDLYERRIAESDPVLGVEKEHPAVRAAAARALAMHGDPSHVPLILPLLGHAEGQIRLEAVQALQRLHHPAAIRPLMDLVLHDNEPEPDVRAEAADALGQYAELPVLRRLFIALDDDALAVTSRAHKSLRTLTGQDLPDDRRMWVEWLEEAEKPFAERQPYVYPVFRRGFRWTDVIPFTRPARNEIPANPIGAQAG